MKPLSIWSVTAVLGMVLLAPHSGRCQTKADAAPTTPSSDMPDYPDNRPGVLIHGADWAALDSTMPAKTRAKNGIAQSLSYGAVRGTIVADYAGEHAAVQVKPGRVVICVCRLLSIPGDPVIVKLHPQKGGMRELDGGKLPILGGKMADASKNDLIPVTVSRPDNGFWLVQSQDALPEGEYALMFGTQNVAIFTFTVSAVPADSSKPAAGSH